MDKTKEKKGNVKLQSDEKARDQAFERWVQQQFIAEAAAIEKEIDEIPDSEELEPTEEKFQKLLQKAKEQGTIYSETGPAQTKISEDSIDEKKDTAASEMAADEKLNRETEVISHKKAGRRRFAGLGEKVIKWTAVAAVTVFGIFGVSMTSEANRAYVMETVNNITGNNTETEVDNDDTMKNATTEEEARNNIENAMKVEIPRFFYWPSEFEYKDYSINTEAQTSIIEYANDKNFMRLIIISNIQNASFLATSDSGEKIRDIQSEAMEGMKSALCEVLEEGDDKPTYILQWEYKNVYYELSGKVLETEMENIAENIVY